MKKNYILPSTQSVAFSAGFICQTGSPAAGGSNVNVSGPNIGSGGGSTIVDDPD